MTARFIGWMMSAIILLLLFITAALLLNPVRLLITGTRADGIVVGMDTAKQSTQSDQNNLLLSPIVEFVTVDGEKVNVHSRDHAASPSIGIGETLKVAYSESNPRNVQFLLVREFLFGPATYVLVFAAFVLLLWISCILISQEPAYGDPLHILPSFITRFRLNPIRFPILSILLIVIPLCGLTACIYFKQATEIRSNGITVMGDVLETRWKNTRLNDNSKTGGWFPTIIYKDAAGEQHTIERSLAKPFSRLKINDRVEVIYPVDAPDKGIVNTWDEFYLVPVFFGCMMIAFLFLFRLVWRGSIWN